MIGLVFKAGLGAFGAAGMVTKLIVLGSIALSLLTAYGVWHHNIASKYYDKGYHTAISDIAKEDKGAIAQATALRSVFRDCRARGLRWDQSTGQCQGR